MQTPDRPTFTWNRDEHDPARRAEAIRRAVEFVSASFAEDEPDEPTELERLLADATEPGLNAVYALRAIAAGYVIGEAEARSEDPLDVLRRIEAALADATS